MIPAVALAVLPKCPACLAAYAAAATGLAVPVAAARGLRTLLILICAAWAIRLAARLYAWRPNHRVLL